tara:strand:+ start:1356 stop:1619 length:264 start_codon:yes stop_codon:yes gene_type:complete
MADLKKRMHFINVLLEKWLTVDKLSNQEIGSKVRHWYWQNEKQIEHWMMDEGDDVYGGGCDSSGEHIPKQWQSPDADYKSIYDEDDE